MLKCQADWVKRKHNIPQSYWISFQEAKLYEELYRQQQAEMIPEWTHKFLNTEKDNLNDRK